MNKGITSPTAQRNIETILAWLDAHNRRDMKAIDCYTDDIEIVEMPTGVVYKGMDKMRELAGMAYRRQGWKELTNIIATETEACVEYVASADISAPLTEEEKRSGQDKHRALRDTRVLHLSLRRRRQNRSRP